MNMGLSYQELRIVKSREKYRKTRRGKLSLYKPKSRGKRLNSRRKHPIMNLA
jgi:hypothetical protein